MAVKVEPHQNGPLFVEMNFYARVGKIEDVEAYRRARGISNLGMPVLRGHGSHTSGVAKYRFLVMDRFGEDLQKKFKGGKCPFSPGTVFNLAIKIVRGDLTPL
jgi:vaccinia related kinase